jgi:gliding motility-associated-like protein
MIFFTRKLLLFLLFITASFCTQAQTANFTSDFSSGCSPLVVAFTNTSTGTTSATKYSWDFGNTITSYFKDGSTTYLSAGTYTVTLTVTNPSGSSSVKKATITVYPSPVASYTSVPLSACPCTNITFTNTSTPNAPGPYTSQWSFGDGSTSTTNNTNYTFCTPGSYNIALKVTNSAGCSNTRLDTAKVIIFEPPVVTFSASKTNLCKVPDSTIFTSYPTKGKAPYTYSWDFGDLGTSILANPSHKYTAAGSYTVTLIVTDANGCKDTVVNTNYIKVVPMHSDFTVPSSVCVGATSTFINTSTPPPVYTKWTFGDSYRTTGSTVFHGYLTGGTYTVTMIDSFGVGCIDTAIKSYTAHPKPKPRFSYSPIYSCPAPATINFNNYSSGADSFLWVFGDGYTSTSVSPAHTYTHDSIFTVYLIGKTVFGCLDTFRVRDTTKPFPNGYPSPFYDSTNSPIIVRIYSEYSSIAVDTPAACLPVSVNPSIDLYTDTYLPLVSDTARMPACLSRITGYSPPYWYCFRMYAPDPYPDPYFDPPYSPPPALVPYPLTPRSYYWDFGDGYTSTSRYPHHVYSVEGIYMIHVRVVTDSGCVFLDSIQVQRGLHPTAAFTMSDSILCKGGSITVNRIGGGGTSYVWDFGDGSIVTDSILHLNHKYHVAGDRRVSLTVIRYGCVDTTSKMLFINPPSSYFGEKYSCDTPLLVHFLDSSWRATSVLWRFGDGDSSILRNPVHTYSSFGTYTVTQITVNDTFGCRDTTTQTISLFKANPSFSALDTTLCKGDTAHLIAILQPYFLNYTWYLNSTFKNDSFGNLLYKFLDTGSYAVSLIAKDIHGCFDTATRPHYIIVGKPQMKLTASPVIGCSPLTVNFIDSSFDTKGAYVVNRKWSFGDATGKTDTSSKANHNYAAGSYTVTLISTDNIGCKDSTTMSIEARKPIAAFNSSVDTFSCIGYNITFANGSSGVDLTYKWYFGDGGTSTANIPVHSYGSVGSYNVKLVVTDATGCKDSITKLNYIKLTKPTASFTMSDSIALCPPLFVNFINTSKNATSYYWDFNNGSTSFTSGPASPYVDSGKYHPILVAYDMHGCTDTATSTVRIMGYDGALKYTPLTGCAPLTVSFSADLINVSVMVWDFADGVTESAVGKPTTTHTYVKPGAYLPRLILGDGKGCSTSSKGIDTIKVDGITPVITFSPACIGTEITFNDSSYSPFSSYASSQWTFEDGSTSSLKQPKRTYSKVGVYTITLISTNTNGCVDTVQQSIEIHPLPKIHVDDTVICLNDIVVLYPTGGTSYTWDANPTLSCTNCSNPTAAPTVPTTYYVTGSDQFGCVNKDTVTVGVKTKTKLITSNNQEACAQTPIELSVSGAYKYNWIPATHLSDSHIANPIATLDSSITYMVIGSEGSCIPDTAYVKVIVHPLPIVNAGPDQRVLSGTTVTLNGTGSFISTYLWTPSLGLSCTNCPNPTATPQTTTTYALIGYSDYGCVDTDSVTIIVFCDQSQLFIPNSFTPNNDGQNDIFYPHGTGVSKIKSFRVYNRWGQMVYEKTNIDVNDKSQGWDGTFKGEQLGSDTFVYTLEATCNNGETVFWKGDITLIK